MVNPKSLIKESGNTIRNWFVIKNVTWSLIIFYITVFFKHFKFQNQRFFHISCNKLAEFWPETDFFQWKDPQGSLQVLNWCNWTCLIFGNMTFLHPNLYCPFDSCVYSSWRNLGRPWISSSRSSVGRWELSATSASSLPSSSSSSRSLGCNFLGLNTPKNLRSTGGTSKISSILSWSSSGFCAGSGSRTCGIASSALESSAFHSSCSLWSSATWS